jgi:hypothetical protein
MSQPVDQASQNPVVSPERSGPARGWNLPFKIRFEQRLNPVSFWYTLFITVLSVVIALLVGAGVLRAYCQSFIRRYWRFL